MQTSEIVARLEARAAQWNDYTEDQALLRDAATAMRSLVSRQEETPANEQVGNVQRDYGRVVQRLADSVSRDEFDRYDEAYTIAIVALRNILAEWGRDPVTNLTDWQRCVDRIHDRARKAIDAAEAAMSDLSRGVAGGVSADVTGPSQAMRRGGNAD